MKKLVERCQGHDIYSVGEIFVIYKGACCKIKFSTIENARAWTLENSLSGINFINR